MPQIYDQVVIWKRAHELAVAVYQLAVQLLPDEQFGLASQVRRSAVSVAANIAEGLGRESVKETVHFLSISRGSAMETSEHLSIAKDLKLVNVKRADYLINEYRGLAAGISAFIKAKKQLVR